MNIKTQFIFKLITKYFIYGYLCIFGISVCLCISYIVYTNFKVPEKYVSVLFLFCSVLS